MGMPVDQVGNENRFMGLQLQISEWYRTQAGFQSILSSAFQVCEYPEILSARLIEEFGAETVDKWASGDSTPHEMVQQHAIEFVFETVINL